MDIAPCGMLVVDVTRPGTRNLENFSLPLISTVGVVFFRGVFSHETIGNIGTPKLERETCNNVVPAKTER